MIKAVFIDSREPEHVRRLRFDGVPLAVDMLEFGDVWAMTGDDLVCIERKTPTDLLGSIADGRIFAQVAGMRTKTQWAYLVVCGDLRSDNLGKTIADGRSTGWEWASVQGALLQIQELGVGVVHSTSDATFEQTVISLCRRTRNGEYVVEAKHESRAMSHGERILTSLPGIGIDRAQAILDYFHGNPAQALAWLTWRKGARMEGEIRGIGSGIKSQVRAALKLADDEELYCWGREEFAYYDAAQRNVTADDMMSAIPAAANQVQEEGDLLLWAR